MEEGQAAGFISNLKGPLESTIMGAASARSCGFNLSAPIDFLGSRLPRALNTSTLVKGLKEKLWCPVFVDVRVTDRDILA